MPVVLVYFKGTLDGGQVILSWETATEINNDFFEIEYSNDRRSWKTVNTVDGLGNSDISIRYEYIDKYRNTTSYYRLKQVDFDGQFEYSAVIRVVGEGSTTSTLMAFPNPFKERVTLTADEFEMKSLRIFNALGKEIKITSEAVSMRHLDVSNLQSGFYYFKTRKTTMKLIKE